MIKKNLMLCCFMIILLIVSSVFAGVYDTLNNTKSTVENISVSSFKDNESYLKTAYLNDLEGVNNTLAIAEDEADISSKNAFYQDSLKIVNTLISKSNGCILNGAPDSDDWIVNCEDASTVNAALKKLANEISALIQ